MKSEFAAASLQAYWRVHDPLCAKALRIGKDPAQFPALKAFFPFVREASLLQVPRTLDFLPAWFTLAFHAGFLYGENLPSQAEELLDQHGVECSEALRRVAMLRDALAESCPTPVNVCRALKQIHANQWPNEPLDLVPAVFGYFKAGLAAATLAKADPCLLEFVDAITPPVDAPRLPLSFRLMMWSPLVSDGKPRTQLLAHPLPRLAATYYPHAPKEREAILNFFRRQLHAFGETTEARCSSAENNIEGWIRRALKYGRQLALNEPKRFQEILAEAGETNLLAAQNAIRLLIEHAGAMELSQAILRWHGKAFQWSEPATYGRYLERVVYCSDFAIWISWLIRNHK